MQNVRLYRRNHLKQGRLAARPQERRRAEERALDLQQLDERMGASPPRALGCSAWRSFRDHRFASAGGRNERLKRFFGPRAWPRSQYSPADLPAGSRLVFTNFSASNAPLSPRFLGRPAPRHRDRLPPEGQLAVASTSDGPESFCPLLYGVSQRSLSTDHSDG